MSPLRGRVFTSQATPKALIVIALCLMGSFRTLFTIPHALADSVSAVFWEPMLSPLPPILSDDFNDNSLDGAKWNSTNLFSGFTNLDVPIAETSQRLEIGPLLQNVNGSSYRGIRTVNSYNFSGGYCYVELVQAASAATAGDAMFTIGNDVNAYYRIYVSAGNLRGQRKIGSTKTTLFTTPYDAVNHRFLRIRHDSVTGNVTLDTAPSNGGVPGTWVQRYTETWNSSISTAAIIFEVKGGTSQAEANPPGKVVFDNFRVAIPGFAGTNPERLDPANRIGGAGEDPLSGNFNWGVPILRLTGRAGLDLGLTLAYNSRVWTKSGSYISFDDDRGFPSPGFRLGFPVIQAPFHNAVAGKNAHLLITPNGDRIELRQVGTSSTLFESTDSSYLLFDTSTMVLRTTDGTQLTYAWMGSDFQCTQIKDRNGNFITINYNQAGRIDTIVDTLNRTIRFEYSGNNLTAIKQTWTVNGATVEHPWASFTYRNPDLTIQTNFPGLTIVGPQNGSTLKVLTQVTVNDGSSFTFDYTSWGQVWKIRHLASNGTTLFDYRSYNLPQDSTTAQTDCPRFTERRVMAKDWNRSGPVGAANLPVGPEQEVITTYSLNQNAQWTLLGGTIQKGKIAQVNQPDGTFQKIYFAGATGGIGTWRRGLISMIEIYQTISDMVTLHQQSVTTWTQDDTSVPFLRNPRVIETNVYDTAGNRARTEISCQSVSLPDGTSCKLPQDVKEYQANATTVLRRTHNEYKLEAPYINPNIRIIGLIKEKTLFEVNPNNQAETLMSKVAFEYDETGSIQGNDTPIQHDNVNYTASFVAGRANVSNVKRYDVTNTALFVKSTTKYNTAGSAVQIIDPSNHLITLTYTDRFAEKGIPLDPARSFTTLAYPTTVADADGFSSSMRYNYDFGAQTWKQTPLPNETVNTPGPQRTFLYDNKGRIELITNLVNNAHTKFIYGPNYVETLTSVNSVDDEAKSLQVFDGLGRLIAKAGNHSNSTGGFSAKLMLYDQMGRVVKQSNPTETSVSISPLPIQPYDWQAAGDDAPPTGNGWLYTQQTYDWKGRPLVTTNADGTTKVASYTGCGCAGGDVVTLTDEGAIDAGVLKRRQQKIYSDVLGRTVKTEVFNWQGGSVYSTTVNTYNARDQLTNVKEYAGAVPNDGSCQSPTCQLTTMTYDGHGRLETRHRPEQKIDPSNSSSTDHTTWIYNPDDTVQKITDARGASKTFSYNNRHLLTSIAYAAPSPIPTPSPVTYGYDSVGNRKSMIDSLGGVTYNYDSLSRLSSETRTFTGVGSFTLTYGYNLANQLTTFTDSFGAQVGYVYNSDRTLKEVNSAGFAGVPNYASEIRYRASGDLKSMNYGNGRSVSLTYNSRLQIATYSVPGVTGSEYRYAALSGGTDNDGRVKFVRDLMQTNSPFDRSYEFDHVGRLTQARTASRARGGGFEQTGPYQEGYSYDAFGNMTQRGGLAWSTEVPTVNLSYADNRNTAWTYDAEGNGTLEDDMTWVRDAAGNAIFFRRPRTPGSTFVDTKDRIFDGDGNYIKEVVNGSATTYYLRSRAFGGEIVTNLGSTGQKLRGFVYALGGILAEQVGSQGGAQWLHSDPVTGNRRWTLGDGQIMLPNMQIDPLGVDAGAAEPPQGQLPGEPDRLHGHGEITNPASGCGIDGIPAPCNLVIGIMNIGAASPCPNNDCSFSTLSYYTPQRDYAHTWGGLLVVGGTRTDQGPITLQFIGGGRREGRGGGGDTLSLYFFDPFQQKPIDWGVFESALKTCISKLWPMFKMTSFSPTTPGGEGGKDEKADGKYNGVIGLVDTTTGTHFNVTNDPTPPPNVKALIIQNKARGATDPNNPWWTYAYPAGNRMPRPGDKRYPELFGAIGMDFVRVQVHETGAALSFIREMYHPTPGPVAPGRLPDDNLDPDHEDDGPSLEDCVGKEYYKQMGLTPH